MGEKLLALSDLCAVTQSCWKMKNSLEIWRVAGGNCCNSNTLPLILLTIESNWGNSTTCYSPTDAIS